MLSATPSMSDPNREPAPSSPPFSRQSRLRRPHEDEDESSSSGGGDADDDVVVAVSVDMLDSSDGASQACVVTTLAMNSGGEASQSRQCEAETDGSKFTGLEAHTLTDVRVEEAVTDVQALDI